MVPGVVFVFVFLALYPNVSDCIQESNISKESAKQVTLISGAQGASLRRGHLTINGARFLQLPFTSTSRLLTRPLRRPRDFWRDRTTSRQSTPLRRNGPPRSLLPLLHGRKKRRRPRCRALLPRGGRLCSGPLRGGGLGPGRAAVGVALLFLPLSLRGSRLARRR